VKAHDPQLPLRPAGHTSVMAGRQVTEDDDLDYFPTPPWAARAGGELILRLDPQASIAEDPACGGGHMAHGMAGHFDEVRVSDIHDWEGPIRPRFLHDFTADDWPGEPVDWFCLNPPFKHAEAFVRAAWKRARRGVAVLARSVFLEGAKRHRLLSHDCPLAVAAQFSERVPMVKGRWDPEASSATAYSWFIHAKPDALPARAPRPGEMWRGCWIPPGTRKRLTRASDMAFAAGADDPQTTTQEELL
jgi:hypothetical protein